MCGRFSQAESSRRLAKVFGAYADENLPEPRYNVAPSLGVRVVLEKDGERRLSAATWGFAPPTDRAAPRARSWINARAETALDSPIFGPALRTRRCLVPADAFYEWNRVSGISQPYAIGPARADEPMALAGIWTPARAAPPTMAVLTTRANNALRSLHHRMPVILGPADWDRWLDASLDGGLLTDLLAPAPDASIRIWPVATTVNRADNEGPELLAQIEPQPTLGLA